jgi:hypothetical protein
MSFKVKICAAYTDALKQTQKTGLPNVGTAGFIGI